MMIQKVTTTACKDLLPQALENYLWQLAVESDAELHTFELSAKYVGVGEVQDILYRRNRFSSWRRVFGCQPVEAVVEVRVTGQQAVMSLQETNRGLMPAEIQRKEELPCSA